MSADVVIIDSGGANIASLRFALDRLGARSELTSDSDRIVAARRVILPGVGAAADAMQRLSKAELDNVITELNQPLLGICLGMQLLLEASEEDSTDCLGLVPGTAKRFTPATGRPVPHMGWNQISIVNDAPLLNGIPNGAYFYFVHSYAADVLPDTVASSDYGHDFSAVIQRDNFMGTQFHPERSGEFGARILQNFLQLN